MRPPLIPLLTAFVWAWLSATEAPTQQVAGDPPATPSAAADRVDAKEEMAESPHDPVPAAAQNPQPPHRPDGHRPGARGDRQGRGPRPPHEPRRGPPSGSQAGPHAAHPPLMRRLDEVMEKLSRIESQLHASAPAHQGSPGLAGQGEAGPRMRAEIQERMEQARRRFGEMEERIRRLEAEVERLKRTSGDPPSKL